MRWPVQSRRLLVGVGSFVGLALTLAVGYGMMMRGREPDASHESPPASLPVEAPAPSRTVTLSEEKASASGLAIGTASTAQLPFEVSVPGRIEADVDRRVDIRTRVPGII